MHTLNIMRINNEYFMRKEQQEIYSAISYTPSAPFLSFSTSQF